MKITITCLLVLCWLVPATARADVFLFDTALSTTGAFGCRSFLACSGIGTNTLTVQNGTGTATLTFTGVNASTPVTNGLTPVTLGSFDLSVSPGFVFPTHPANAELPILYFSLNAVQASPVGSSNHFSWALIGVDSGLAVKIGQSYFTLPSGNPQYPEIIYTFDPFPVRISPNAATRVTANVGAVPEPATMLLLGSGLVAATLARRRRR